MLSWVHFESKISDEDGSDVQLFVKQMRASIPLHLQFLYYFHLILGYIIIIIIISSSSNSSSSSSSSSGGKR
jgi:hypothetical protein